VLFRLLITYFISSLCCFVNKMSWFYRKPAIERWRAGPGSNPGRVPGRGAGGTGCGGCLQLQGPLTLQAPSPPDRVVQPDLVPLSELQALEHLPLGGTWLLGTGQRHLGCGPPRRTRPAPSRAQGQEEVGSWWRWGSSKQGSPDLTPLSLP